MLILLINLDRRPDRLAFMQAQLGTLGLPFERIPAVDGRSAPTAPPAGMTAAEYACAQSHRNAWRRALALGADQALILEDDVVLSARLPALLAVTGLMPPGGEILRLETWLMRSDLGPPLARRPLGLRIHPLRSPHFGCGAYLVTRAFLERAVREITDFTVPVDDLLFLPQQNGFVAAIHQLKPALCIQADLLSATAASDVATSDIAETRQQRLIASGVARPPEKPRRTIWEKCVREVQRWPRKAWRLSEPLRDRFIPHAGWQDVPFAGDPISRPPGDGE